MQFYTDAMLLGPHAGSSSHSIRNYFDFCRQYLPPALPGWHVGALSPGDIGSFDDPSQIPVTRRRAWWQTYVEWPVRLNAQRAHLFHFVDQGLTWYAAFVSQARRVATIHDLIGYLTCSGNLSFGQPPGRRKLLIRECAHQIQRMDHLIGASQYTADCLIRYLEIPAKRITVVQHHADDSFHPLAAAERTRARERWFGSAEYAIIHVGQAVEYKNRIGVLKTFDWLHAEFPQARLFMVHGPPHPDEASFLAQSPCGKSVTFLPVLTRSQLREFYGAADALVFPSLYEGFGWPPLEAMACGCPVVSSTRAALREVVGDAALTVDDPHDHRAFAAALRSILRDPCTGRDLRERGFRRVESFRPSIALERIAEVYRRLV